MLCAECLRDLQDVVKAEDSNLYLCGLCHEKQRVHWKILLSTDMEEQAFLANTLRVIERADQSRPKDYGRTASKPR
jgi:protein-arginine kinase activator protein McsA